MSFPSTEFVVLKGKAKWARLTVPNKFGKWSIDLYLDSPSLEKMRELQAEGVKNRLKKDEDGWFVTLSRPTEKKFRGNLQGLTPPEILDGSHQNPDGSYQSAPGLVIGNGSEVAAQLETYMHKVPDSNQKAKAARLLSVRVDKLVEYTPERDMDEDQYRAVKKIVKPEEEEMF